MHWPRRDWPSPTTKGTDRRNLPSSLSAHCLRAADLPTKPPGCYTWVEGRKLSGPALVTGRTAVTATAAVPGPPGNAGVLGPAAAHPRVRDAAIPTAAVPLQQRRLIAARAEVARWAAHTVIRTAAIPASPFAILAVLVRWHRAHPAVPEAVGIRGGWHLVPHLQKAIKAVFTPAFSALPLSSDDTALP